MFIGSRFKIIFEHKISLHIQTISHHIFFQFLATSWQEWTAFIFALAQVFFALKNKTINFYFGIVSVSFYAFVFYKSGLRAEALLQLYYLYISLSGIFLWNKNKQGLQISWNTIKEWKKTFTLLSFLFLVLFLILNKYTTSNVIFWDTFVATFAWVGAWLLIKRKIENWILLSISNIVAIPLFIYKELELTALLTIIYLILGIWGFFAWRKEMKLAKTI